MKITDLSVDFFDSNAGVLDSLALSLFSIFDCFSRNLDEGGQARHALDAH